jgi:hypothetical protein
MPFDTTRFGSGNDMKEAMAIFRLHASKNPGRNSENADKKFSLLLIIDLENEN